MNTEEKVTKEEGSEPLSDGDIVVYRKCSLVPIPKRSEVSKQEWVDFCEDHEFNPDNLNVFCGKGIVNVEKEDYLLYCEDVFLDIIQRDKIKISVPDQPIQIIDEV